MTARGQADGSTTRAWARAALVRRLRRTAVLGVAGVVVAAGAVVLGQAPAQASTSQFKGVNWADRRDNFVNGVLYVSGLGASDTYSSASATANQVVGQLYSMTGANTVRLPVNEPTVSTYWGTYTGAIDTALTKGSVILAYWAHTGGKPPNSAAFDAMWDTIVAKYAGNPRAYFEVINEPYGLGATELNNLYHTWLTRYPGVPRGRVILDGTGTATNVVVVGNDTRLDGTLLAAHDYTMNMTPPLDSEGQWASHLASYVGAYAGRTVVTEWGAPMGPGSKYDIQWDSVDYSIPSGSWWADYIRGISSHLRSSGMGSVYWPGLRDGDWYSLTTRAGTGAGTSLSLVNPSGLLRIQYAWGVGTGGSTTVGVRNAATGLVVDGLGRTANGSAPGLAAGTDVAERQWTVENDGTYVRFANRATGLYLDGMGRTASGSAAGQYARSSSTNQQWSVVTDANNVRIKNRATGLFLEAAGSALVQTGDTNATAQQWRVVAVQEMPTTPTSTPPTTPPTTPTSTPPTTPPTTPTTTPPTTTPTTSGASCRVSFAPSAWATGFTVDVTVVNASSAAVDGWALSMTLPAGQTLTNGWNAVFTGATGTVTARNASYNATIPAGGSARFGFQGTLSGGTYAAPTVVALNGAPCTVA